MQEKKQEEILRRLKSIAGHIKGIEKMVTEDAYCIDVISQIQAVQAALSKVNVQILDDHLHSCVITAVRGDDAVERNECLVKLPVSLQNQRKFNSYSKGEISMTTLTVNAPAISCAHCVHTIENEIGELAGVQNVQASEQSKLVTIIFDQPASEQTIKELLAEIGYPAQAD